MAAAAATSADTCYARCAQFAETMSVRIARAVSSWRFLFSLAACMTTWVAINGDARNTGTYDPYPYVLLNLVLSFIAAYTAPFIMMRYSC